MRTNAQKITTTLLLALLLVLSLSALVSCGGDDTPEVTYTVYCFPADGGAATEKTVSKQTDNSVGKPAMPGRKFLGYYTAEGAQIFNAEGKQVDGIIIDKNITVYAKFEDITYTLQFDAGQGALAEAEASRTVTQGAALGTFPTPAPAAANLQFDGWYNKELTVAYSAGATPADAQFDITAHQPNGTTVTLYAKYSVKKVAVTLDYNDGSFKLEHLTFDYGTAADALASYKTVDEVGKREIIGFSTNRYELTEPTAPFFEDITLYAIWQNYKHVTLVYGEGDERVAKIYDGGIAGAELPVAVKPGYSFDGWYPTAALSGNPVEYISFSALADRYYAKFTVTDYELTFVTGGNEVVEPMHYFYGDTTTLPLPERTGYLLLGWAFEPDGVGDLLYSIPADLYGNYTLYAVWEAESYVVELKPNGGTVTAAQSPVSFNGVYLLPVPTRTGYDFLGWFDGTGEDAVQYTNAKGQSIAPWTHTEGATLFAKWRIATYTITFQTAGGTTVRPLSYQYGELLCWPATPVKVGLTFDGWYNEALDTEYTGVLRVAENLTLYAKWVESVAITDAEGLKAIAGNPAGTYHLVGDINLLGESWTPIADFTGTLNGNGYKIHNFTISTSYTGVTVQYGLFAKNSGTIRNLVLDDFSVIAVNGQTYVDVGTIAGRNAGRILNCTVQNATMKGTFNATCVYGGNVSFAFRLGGVAGICDGGTIIGTTSKVDISAALTGTARHTYFWSSDNFGTSMELYAGGIAGGTTAATNISYCSYEGGITTRVSLENGDKLEDYNIYGHLGVGGIVPTNAGRCHGNESSAVIDAATAINCRNGRDDCYAFTDLHVGGISSVNHGSVTACKADGSVTVGGSVLRAGGVCGYNAGGTVENCYSTATVQANGGAYIGGLLGINSGSVLNCYTAGEVIAAGGYVGGFVGVNEAKGSISGCYAASTVSSSGGSVRAFSGTTGGSIRSCYFAGDAAFTIGGSPSASSTADATKLDTAAELYAVSFLTDTLYWGESHWRMSGEAHPTLYWETEALIEYEE